MPVQLPGYTRGGVNRYLHLTRHAPVHLVTQPKKIPSQIVFNPGAQAQMSGTEFSNGSSDSWVRGLGVFPMVITRHFGPGGTCKKHFRIRSAFSDGWEIIGIQFSHDSRSSITQLNRWIDVG